MLHRECSGQEWLKQRERVDGNSAKRVVQIPWDGLSRSQQSEGWGKTARDGGCWELLSKPEEGCWFQLAGHRQESLPQRAIARRAHKCLLSDQSSGMCPLCYPGGEMEEQRRAGTHLVSPRGATAELEGIALLLRVWLPGSGSP